MKTMMTLSAFLWSMAGIISSSTFAVAIDFMNLGDLTEVEAKEVLMKELKGNFRLGASKDRVPELEAALISMWKSVPKTDDGLLEHSAVRYMLHRLLMEQHGWFIRGLEPTSDNTADSLVHNSLKEWVPSYLQDILEHLSGTSGMDLHQLAVLAATLEDLVHRESKERLEAIYPLASMSTDEISPDVADDLLSKYLMVYLLGGNVSISDMLEADRKMDVFSQKYTGWAEVHTWLHSLQQNVTQGDQPTYDSGTILKVVEEVSKHFVDFNDMECKELKTTLLAMEGAREGRIRLADFYKQGLHSHWNFNEKIDYLRTLGAIDDSNSQRPYVIVPNYLQSRPNCFEASKFYAVCCRNECEDLMGQLEKQIQAPAASPSTILMLVASLSSDTVRAPRILSESLVNRLNEVATQNGGEVPLHGRLFAQWMHHAFPRECPYPHDTIVKTSPLTPDEWMSSTGESAASASQEELMSYMEDATCAVDLSNPSASSGCGEAGKVPDEPELPWIKTELLIGRTKPTLPPPKNTLNLLMRGIVVAGVALGLVLLSWSSLGRQNTVQSMRNGMGFIKPSFNVQRRTVAWWINLMLYFFPLSVVSLDFVFDGEVGNGALTLALCWALVVMVGHALLSKYGSVPMRKAVKHAADQCLPFDNGKYCV